MHRKILSILKLRDKPTDGSGFTLRDDSDGNGPYIEEWEASLGAVPTQAEINAAADLPIPPSPDDELDTALAAIDTTGSPIVAQVVAALRGAGGGAKVRGRR